MLIRRTDLLGTRSREFSRELYAAEPHGGRRALLDRVSDLRLPQTVPLTRLTFVRARRRRRRRCERKRVGRRLLGGTTTTSYRQPMYACWTHSERTEKSTRESSAERERERELEVCNLRLASSKNSVQFAAGQGRTSLINIH